jgi:hypothetical protein
MDGSERGEGKMVRRGNGQDSGSIIGDGKSKQKLVLLVSELIDAFDDDDRLGIGNGNGDGGNSVRKRKSASGESSLADQFGHH